MEDLPDVPEEFLEPILPCLHLLENANIHLYAVEKCLWKKYCRLALNVGCLVTYQIALTVYLVHVFRGNLKLDELAYVVSVYVVSIQAILKAAVVVLYKKEIRSIVLHLGNMWRIEELTEVQIGKKNALLKRLKLCYAVFYWINMIGSWQYILAPLWETLFRKFILQEECGLLLPFSCSFPFDPTGNWARYIGVYIFETYSMFRIVYFYLGTEFLMITLCSHLATAFTLLQQDLLNIEPGKIEPLRVVVDRHQKLISLSEQLDNVFDKVIFFNLTSASISICFFGLSAKVSHGALTMANNFVAVLSLILPLFNLCYYGELLREASFGMAEAVYNSQWYRGDVRFQKLLWIIMRSFRSPGCEYTVNINNIKEDPKMCICDDNLTRFTTPNRTVVMVLSTTWSYFSLASSVYEGES